MKTVIVLATLKRIDAKTLFFDFDGFVAGEEIHSIELQTNTPELFKKDIDYLMYTSLEKVENKKLSGQIIKFKKL